MKTIEELDPMNNQQARRIFTDNYKTAWNKLKDYVECLQEGHENLYAYSNEYLEYVEEEINQLEERCGL